MALECSSYQKKNSIAWITLNRPSVLNALNRKLWLEIYENLERAEKDKEIRAVLITGAGRAFCAGDDIKEVANLKTPEELRAFFLEVAVPTITKFVQLPKPIIAAINGPAYGGGCEIAMLCDIVIASENASFAVPEALIGAIPPIAPIVGAYIIGKLNISMMMLTGEPLSVQEAKSVGLVNRVVSAQELKSAAEKMALKTMRAAPSSIGAIKRLLYQQFTAKRIMQSVEELIRIVQSDEGKEGHKAFAQKRAPKWAKS